MNAAAIAQARAEVEALRGHLFGLECADDYCMTNGSWGALYAQVVAAEGHLASLLADTGSAA